jgi:hypothetical protein
MKKILTLIIGTLLLTITACSEKTSERVEVTHDNTPAIVVPDKKVNVTIHNDAVPAPVIINHDSNTTITTHTDDAGSVTTKTHSETVH